MAKVDGMNQLASKTLNDYESLIRSTPEISTPQILEPYKLDFPTHQVAELRSVCGLGRVLDPSRYISAQFADYCLGL